MQSNLCDFHKWLLKEYGEEYNSLFGIATPKIFQHDSVIESRLVLLYEEFLGRMGFLNIQHTKNVKRRE